VTTAYAERTSGADAGLWSHGSPLLGQLDVELTERCNNDCIHCCISLPEDDVASRAQEMKTAEVKAVLTEAAALGALAVRFTGGEPLLREDFDELYLFARRLGLKVILFTNARLVTPKRADLLARLPPLRPVEVSAYGMKQESYEAVSRRPGSFLEFRRGVELLRERGVWFVVKSALLPPNRAELAEFDAWAAALPHMEQQPGCSMFFDLRHRRDSPARNRQIAGLRVTPEQGLAVLTRDRTRYVAELREFCAKFLGPPGNRLFTCGAGLGCAVDAYGKVQPCLSLRDPGAACDLKSGSLRDALTTTFPRLREARATNPSYLSRCAKCFLKGLCEQCPAKSWAEHGTLDTPVEYLCQVAHVQARYLGLLGDSEPAWTVPDWRARVERFCRGVEPG